jgi:hypothetical protein
VKLFVSALLLAAIPAVFAQQNAGQAKVFLQNGAALSPQQATALARSEAAEAETIGRILNQTGCPLYLQSASVAPEGGYLPVTAQTRQDGALNLRFRNQSGKAIAGASITARVNVKTNIYALDAHALELRLTLSGTQDLDKTLDQTQQIALPQHVYLFGVARVTLDQVMYADGSVWNAPATSNSCRTLGSSVEGIAR